MAKRILKYAGLARQALNVTIQSHVFLSFVYPILTRLCVALLPMCPTAHASVRSQLENKYRANSVHWWVVGTHALLLSG